MSEPRLPGIAPDADLGSVPDFVPEFSSRGPTVFGDTVGENITGATPAEYIDRTSGTAPIR